MPSADVEKDPLVHRAVRPLRTLGKSVNPRGHQVGLCTIVKIQPFSQSILFQILPNVVCLFISGVRSHFADSHVISDPFMSLGSCHLTCYVDDSDLPSGSSAAFLTKPKARTVFLFVSNC